MKTKIIQITSGRGPIECCWVVAQVLKFFIEDLKRAHINYELIQRVQGIENGTLQSATLQIKGKDIDVFLKGWLGPVQWIGKSAFRKFQKRRNWFIGVYEIKDVVQTIIKDEDIKFQAIRSSGPGGQHVNKVSSAIRAVHITTGVQVLVMESRSQHQNKKIALKRLQEKAAAFNKEQLKASVKNQWENHLDLERGNPIRVFTGSDFKSQNVNKSYKQKRQVLKQNLRQQKWD